MEEDAPFCLAGLNTFESDNPETTEKVDALMDGRIDHDRSTKTKLVRACNIGGCTLKIVQSPETGNKQMGECKAASYCLKEKFEAVGQAATVDEGRALYREIIETTEGHTSKYSAGNFCPRLTCDLSAGVSIDGCPGTAGECETSPNGQEVLFNSDLVG